MRMLSLVLMVSVLLATAAGAQTVSVTIDGTPVSFQGARAQVVNGRVLVPLRGVFEQMGAFVGWDPSTRTVLAQRGDTDVSLPLGSTTARVNGQPVRLDVPASVIGGRTLVPLRFIGEALGATVTWNAATRTVEIVTGEAGPGQPPPPGPVSISSITHNASGWLRAGDRLQVELEGTPGGSASFEIPGETGRIAMTEVASGRYEGTWRVPTDAPAVEGAAVLGQLVVGGASRVIQAGTAINVDTQPPAVRNLLPAPDTAVGRLRPTISATFDDAGGSGVDTASVQLTVNGRDVTRQADVTATFINYRPAANLPTGANRVALTVSDQAGNEATADWQFTLRGEREAITSVEYVAPRPLRPGDVISVTMAGTAGGQGRFWFLTPDGRRVGERALDETSRGVYEGEYTVRRDDDLAGATVVVSLRTPAGETFTSEAETPLGSVGGELGTPTIAYPTEGSSVDSPVTLRGTAPAGATVRLTVSYVSTVLGGVQVRGTLAQQTMTATRQGRFESDPISLQTVLAGRSTRYTATAVTVGPNGELSDADEVTFSRR